MKKLLLILISVFLVFGAFAQKPHHQPKPLPWDSLNPNPKPFHKDSLKPNHKPLPWDTVKPEPKPFPKDTTKPNPGHFPFDSTGHHFRHFPFDSLRPHHDSMPWDTVMPKPHNNPYPGDTTKPNPNPGDSTKPSPKPCPGDTTKPNPPKPYPGNSIKADFVVTNVFLKSQTQLEVDLQSFVNTTLSVQLFDLSGNLQMSYSENLVKGPNSFIINLSNLKPGIYVVQITDTNGFNLKQTIKFVKF